MKKIRIVLLVVALLICLTSMSVGFAYGSCNHRWQHSHNKTKVIPHVHSYTQKINGHVYYRECEKTTIYRQAVYRCWFCGAYNTGIGTAISESHSDSNCPDH